VSNENISTEKISTGGLAFSQDFDFGGADFPSLPSELARI
jgi:hypothetical protein